MQRIVSGVTASLRLIEADVGALALAQQLAEHRGLEHDFIEIANPA